jgi:ribose transport system permease protein
VDIVIEEQPTLARREGGVDDGRDAGDPAAERRRLGGRMADVGFRYGVLIFLLVLIVGFSVALPDLFPTRRNFETIFGDQAIPGILALAVLLPLMAGEFDLSVGAVLGFSAILLAWLTIRGVPTGVAIPITLLVAGLVGIFNAFCVVVLGLNAFIATLGTATILSGLGLGLTEGATLFDGIPEAVLSIARTEVAGVPAIAAYFLVIAVVMWYLIEHTPLGRYIRATGLAREAARLSGVRTSAYLGGSFIAAALISGLAGTLYLGRVGAAAPTIGPEFLLPAYAAAFLGATTIRPGFFNVWGTVTGVFVLAVGTTGLALLGAPFWIGPTFNGAALIAAVTVAVVVGRKRSDHASA